MDTMIVRSGKYTGEVSVEKVRADFKHYSDKNEDYCRAQRRFLKGAIARRPRAGYISERQAINFRMKCIREDRKRGI